MLLRLVGWLARALIIGGLIAGIVTTAIVVKYVPANAPLLIGLTALIVAGTAFMALLTVLLLRGWFDR